MAVRVDVPLSGPVTPTADNGLMVPASGQDISQQATRPAKPSAMRMASHTDPEKGTQWRAVLAATLVGIVVAMNIGKVPIAMPQLREQFGLSLVAAGWIVSMFNTLAVLSGVFFGMLCDGVGALRLCYVGLAVSLGGGLLGILSPNENLLLISRFLEGAGFIAVAVSAPTLIMFATAPRDLKFALGIWSGFLPAGISLSILLAPIILGSQGWPGVWWMVLAMLLLSTAALHANRSSYGVLHSAVHVRNALANIKQALHQPAPWLLALSFTFYTIQFFAVIIWLPTFLKEQRDYSTLAIAGLAALVVLVNVPGNLLGGALVQRNLSRGNLISLTCLAMGLCGVGIFSDSVPDLLRYLLCLSLSFMGGIIPAAILSSTPVLARTPQQSGTLQGLFMQGANLGQFIGPPLVASRVAESGRWQDALLVTGTAAALGVILGQLARRFE